MQPSLDTKPDEPTAPPQRSTNHSNLPDHKRDVEFQHKMARALKMVKEGGLKPSVRAIKESLQCGNDTAQAIQTELVRLGVCVRNASRQVVLAARPA